MVGGFCDCPETWRDLRNGRYRVSSKGRVFSIRSGKMLQPFDDGRGYHHVVLQLQQTPVRITKSMKIHRLVALAFIPNPNGYDTVDHTKGNKLHNCTCQLRWMPRGENARIGNMREYMFVNPSGEPVSIENLQQFCKLNNLNQGCMHRVYRGRASHHKGWTRYADK